MSKSAAEQYEEALESVTLAEAELDSLKEELSRLEVVNHSSVVTFPKRQAYVQLRIARLGRQIPEMRARTDKDRVHTEWLARIDAPKRG